MGGTTGRDARPGDAPARVAVAEQPASTAWDVENIRILSHLADVRLGELCAVPAGHPDVRRWGRFTPAGGVEGDLATDRTLATAWPLLLDRFGALPWGHVDVVLGDQLWPRGVSFPGVVLLSADLVRRAPLAGRYLYLPHELTHQWIGNLAVVPEDRRAEAEALVDAIARLLTCRCLPAAARQAYLDLYAAYRTLPESGLAQRGELVENYHPRLERGELLTDLRAQLDAVRDGIAATGERRPVAVPAASPTRPAGQEDSRC
jgi:hypothetical protein